MAAGRALTIASLHERVGCQERGVSPHVGTFRNVLFFFAAGNLLERIVLVSPLCVRSTALQLLLPGPRDAPSC